MAIVPTASKQPKTLLCPFCKAQAQMSWGHMSLGGSVNFGKFAVCNVCSKATYWQLLGEKPVYPAKIEKHFPHADMPSEIQKDFVEAANIEQDSPRGAAALLRLAIQKMCKELGESGNNINEDIKNLVKKGLSPDMQKAMDAVRVIGNEQVHPGVLDLRDNPQITNALFEIVNLIVEQTISRTKKINQLYELLPQDKKEAIEKRDKQ